jgi:hypothetical protein
VVWAVEAMSAVLAVEAVAGFGGGGHGVGAGLEASVATATGLEAWDRDGSHRLGGHGVATDGHGVAMDTPASSQRQGHADSATVVSSAVAAKGLYASA